MVKKLVSGVVVAVHFLWNCSAQPIITEQPQDRAVTPGAMVTFKVAATSATRLLYQWQFNGDDLPGATGRDLIFRATPQRVGTYAVRIRDADAEELSAPAQLEVQSRPRVLVQSKNTVVGVGGTMAFDVVLNDSGPYSTIVWHNSNTIEGSHIIPDGLGSDVHSTHLVITDCQDDPIYEGLYWISVTNNVGGTVSRRVHLTVVGPPLIVRNPIDRTVRAGQTASFSIAYARDPAPQKTCQWFKDGNAIPGATSRVLYIFHAQKSAEGSYGCAVTSMGGRRDSSIAYLRISP